VWSDTPVSAHATARTLSLGSAGERVGAVDFSVGDQTMSVPLLLNRSLSDPGPAWRFSHPGELSASG
ncbi:MAG TPA: D-alanyl-D-alanine carboxypeptidase, partial [Cryobacterium sp.]|nr:D-alanyl-D-alanine carboxypeptidase [Cryobacterium sp.]